MDDVQSQVLELLQGFSKYKEVDEPEKLRFLDTWYYKSHFNHLP
jgi:hypothetical protein